MKKFLSEKNIVIILFVLVFIIFSLAQKDSERIQQPYIDANVSATTLLDISHKPVTTSPTQPIKTFQVNIPR